MPSRIVPPAAGSIITTLQRFKTRARAVARDRRQYHSRPGFVLGHSVPRARDGKTPEIENPIRRMIQEPLLERTMPAAEPHRDNRILPHVAAEMSRETAAPLTRPAAPSTAARRRA